MSRERMVLSVTVLLLIVGGIALAFTDRTLPDALIALGGTALGALRGGGQGDPAQPVTIEQPGGEPVLTTEVTEADLPKQRRRRR